MSDSQFDESEKCDGRDFLDSKSDRMDTPFESDRSSW